MMKKPPRRYETRPLMRTMLGLNVGLGMVFCLSTSFPIHSVEHRAYQTRKRTRTVMSEGSPRNERAQTLKRWRINQGYLPSECCRSPKKQWEESDSLDNIPLCYDDHLNHSRAGIDPANKSDSPSESPSDYPVVAISQALRMGETKDCWPRFLTFITDCKRHIGQHANVALTACYHSRPPQNIQRDTSIRSLNLSDLTDRCAHDKLLEEVAAVISILAFLFQPPPDHVKPTLPWTDPVNKGIRIRKLCAKKNLTASDCAKIVHHDTIKIITMEAYHDLMRVLRTFDEVTLSDIPDQDTDSLSFNPPLPIEESRL